MFVKDPLLYIPLREFINGIYGEMFRAGKQMEQLQKDYLNAMAADHTDDALQATELAGWLEVGALAIEVHFATAAHSHPSLFKRALYFLKLAQRPPDGVYLQMTTKEKAEISFTISFDKEKWTGEMQAPEGEQTTNYYVLTKAF